MGALRSASHWGAFRADVADGRIVRITPFEHDPHPTDLIQVWTEMATSPMRVRTPVARRGWLAGDGGAARGEDSFVEIGWERALDLAAGEIDRVRRDFGNPSLFAGSYGWSSAGRLHHARTLIRRFFNCIGGFTDQVTNYSYGAAMAFLPRVVGVNDAVGGALTSLETIRDHCDVMLAFGGIPAKNWEVQSGGFGEHRYDDFMDAVTRTTRVFNITPHRADTPAAFPSEWTPIRPNTDTALLIALTYEIVKSGAEDKDFLARCCEGFDAYRAYLLGEVDGAPKTPEWASAITGVPAGRIRDIAEALKGKRALITATWSLQRARHGEQPYWAIIALAAALGQIGLPGGGFAFGYGSSNGMGNPRYDAPLYGPPIGENPTGLAIPVARVADLLLNPGETLLFNGRRIVYPDIKLVYWAGGNPFHHHQDLNRLREAFRRPETVIVNECYWTATARHADIVFPATTAVERNDIGGASRDPFVLAMHKLIEPVGDARNDYDIFADLAQRLGARDVFTEGRDESGWLKAAWDAICDRLRRRGMEPPSFEAFWEQGFLKVDRPSEPYVMFAGFRADPAAHPLPTPSGRIEIFSQSIADMKLDGQTGHPVWLPPEEWLGADLAKTYPLHLLTPQPARRLHAQMDWSAVSARGKRQGREIVAMNPEDAAARGLSEGELVRLFNARGACLAIVGLDPGMRRGVAALPTGATFDPDGRMDRNSNPNALTRDIGTSELGQGCAAQSCLVEIERHAAPAPDLRTNAPPAQRKATPDDLAALDLRLEPAP